MTLVVERREEDMEVLSDDEVLFRQRAARRMAAVDEADWMEPSDDFTVNDLHRFTMEDWEAR